METQRSSPPAYLAHNPAELNLPSVPRTALSRPQVHGEITLPGVNTILSPEFEEVARQQDRYAAGTPTSARSLPRIDPGYAPISGVRTSIEAPIISPSEAGSAMSVDDRGVRSTSSVSMDDPDVRIAAEALSGLGNPDFARSPISRPISHGVARANQPEPEPLLELFTRSHPWVVGTINGSLNAYAATKNYSPRFVQAGANLVERNVTIPMASTVSSVGRMTGIESSLRWYYGGNNRISDGMERGGEGGTSKRRRLDNMDIESRTMSLSSDSQQQSEEAAFEPLPAYRASKPPSYREDPNPMTGGNQLEHNANSQGWIPQLLVSTSGLGVALSQTSRNSLKYCLGLLSTSAERVSTLMKALTLVLEQYDQASDAFHQSQYASAEKGERAATPEHDESARRLAALLKRHSDEIWQTLQTVVNHVSNSAGGALPENARQFVRGQLMSLPQRWRVVSHNQTGQSETSRSAHRMIDFAKEGLDMIGQVSETMRLTLASAESWLERVGRRRELADSPLGMEKDITMNDIEAQRPPNEKQY